MVEHFTIEQRLAILQNAVEYAINRLDADKAQVQVAGDLAVSLARSMTEAEYNAWKERQNG